MPALPDGRSPCTWVQTVSASTGTRVGLWRPAGTSEPYETDNTALIDAVKNDVAQSALMLSVLQLLRSRIMTRRLAFGPEPVIDPSLDRDLVLFRDLALNLATGLPLALARALPLALARELNFVRNPAAVDLPHLDGLDLNLAGDIEIALGLTDPHLAPAPARVLAGVLDLARVLDLACVLDGDLGLDSDLALALMIRIDVVVDRYLRSNPDTSAFQAKLDEGCRLVLGRAFLGGIHGNPPDQQPLERLDRPVHGSIYRRRGSWFGKGISRRTPNRWKLLCGRRRGEARQIP